MTFCPTLNVKFATVPEVAKAVIDVHRKTSVPIRAVECPACGQWHVLHMTAMTTRPRRRKWKT
jgi:hypothetical protein